MSSAPNTTMTATLDAPVSDAARVRVVKPVGGREGWQAIQSEEAPQDAARAAAEQGDGAVGRWLRAYIGTALEPGDRILLILYHFEGLNFREIGAVTEEPEASVEARLAGLNHALRDALHAFQRGRSSSI